MDPKTINMKLAILIAIGIALWLGGYAIKGIYVSDDIGKGIGAIGWLILAYVCFFLVKNWFHKEK